MLSAINDMQVSLLLITRFSAAKWLAFRHASSGGRKFKITLFSPGLTGVVLLWGGEKHALSAIVLLAWRMLVAYCYLNARSFRMLLAFPDNLRTSISNQ